MAIVKNLMRAAINKELFLCHVTLQDNNYNYK